MEKLLVSSCLLGCEVRYNAGALNLKEEDYAWLTNHFELVSFCPEVSAGLPIPRPAAEIESGSGTDVLNGTENVIDINGVNVSEAFKYGAQLALDRCLAGNIHYALLTESSPSCGSSFIYDGSFSGTKKHGSGVTASLLRQHGIRVFSQHDIDLIKRELE